LSLSPNITVKEDDNTTSHVFNKVDLPLGKTGTLRSNVDLDPPEKETLYVASSVQGKGVSIGDRHSLTMDKTVVDANGNLIRGYVTTTWFFPRSAAFTPQMMIDITHQLYDVTVSTSSFDVDDDTLKSLLRGES